MLNEKTKVSLNIINFLLLFGFIITVVFTWATWTANIENEIDINKTEIIREIKERKIADEAIEKRMDEIMPLMQQNQTDLASIQTDIEWIKSMQLQLLERLDK